MSGLVEFLLARIADDEAAMSNEIEFASRVLAECEAKRRIVDLHRAWDGNEWQSPPYFSAPMDEVLACLALPYADHPDYRDEWKL